MFNYEIFYKSTVDLNQPIKGTQRWDTFISAYTSAARTTQLLEQVEADNKISLVFPEYGYAAADVKAPLYFLHAERNEASYINSFLQWSAEKKIPLGGRLAIDITGFIRPYLMFLILQLKKAGVKSFDALYAEPQFYAEREQTKFSDESVREVRQVSGFEGSHNLDNSKDLLIISAGYDDQLITQVAEHKALAKKLQMFGFPSLQADMYQENRLRAGRAQDALGPSNLTPRHAPASDPFATATELSRTVELLKLQISNLYLCPIASKPQVLGFILFFLREGVSLPCSMLYPFCDSYSRETATGISRIWRYTVEL